jgi:hypothetical protein
LNERVRKTGAAAVLVVARNGVEYLPAALSLFSKEGAVDSQYKVAGIAMMTPRRS